MGVFTRLLFGLSIVVAPIVVWATSASLPQRVASHFARGGYANGWMSHDAYVALMVPLTTIVPLVVVLTTGFVPRFATSRFAIKNRDYWLSPQRREETMSSLGTHACGMGVLIILFMTGMHFLVLEANLRQPPRLDESTFLVVLIGFLVLLAIFIGSLALRFGRR